MKLKLKKVNAYQLAKFFAVLYACLAIIVVIPMGLFSATFGQPFAWWMIIVLPIVYGVGGLIGGLIMGGLYNLITKWTGGLEFDFEEIEKFKE